MKSSLTLQVCDVGQCMTLYLNWALTSTRNDASSVCNQGSPNSNGFGVFFRFEHLHRFSAHSHTIVSQTQEKACNLIRLRSDCYSSGSWISSIAVDNEIILSTTWLRLCKSNISVYLRLPGRLAPVSSYSIALFAILWKYDL